MIATTAARATRPNVPLDARPAYRALVAVGSVALTLVAPSRISIDGPLAQRRTASFTSLKLDFPNELGVVHGTPEPGTWLLLGAGVAGLLLAQRRAS